MSTLQVILLVGTLGVLVLATDVIFGMTQGIKCSRRTFSIWRFFFRVSYSDNGWRTETTEPKDRYTAKHFISIDRVTAQSDGKKVLRIVFTYFSLDIALLSKP